MQQTTIVIVQTCYSDMKVIDESVSTYLQ